ncbi:MAG: 50S ribosomal protein L17 [Candidatus Moranbacteria bacterium]|nr:50S ribosomal protein L17 [Candidatus Moranbacteria bacterium]
MNHRKTGRILSRNRNQRRALYKTMLGSLIVRGRIETTEAKAKELKNLIDRHVNRAKLAASDEGRRVASLRELHKSLPAAAIDRLASEEFLSGLSGRQSGYTRVVKLEARKGDGAKMAVIEFVSNA